MVSEWCLSGGVASGGVWEEEQNVQVGEVWGIESHLNHASHSSHSSHSRASQTVHSILSLDGPDWTGPDPPLNLVMVSVAVSDDAGTGPIRDR